MWWMTLLMKLEEKEKEDDVLNWANDKMKLKRK
jgi:hypothetical protein